MNGIRIAKVGVENSTFGFDKLFTYKIPDILADKVQPGCRVFVPFGRGNVKRQAFVFFVEDTAVNPTERLKNIDSVLDDTPVLNKELCEIALFLKEQTFCTYFEAVRALLPKGASMKTVKCYRLIDRDTDIDSLQENSDTSLVLTLLKKKGDFLSEKVLLKALNRKEADSLFNDLLRRGIIESNRTVLSGSGEKSISLLRATDPMRDAEEYDLTQRQTTVYHLLCDVGAATVKELCYYSGCSASVVSALVEKGAAVFFESVVDRSLSSRFQSEERHSSIKKLSKTQQKAYDTLLAAYREHQPRTALLFGVTGSGKTGVYLKLIEQVLADGRNCIVMVPEIALTPQTLQVFSAAFGSSVAVLHSSLSVGERYDEWQRINRGEARIVVGTRSAVFAPLDNVGLIVIDEEQEHTYKSEMTPRYHARDVAKFRCKNNNALLLLASATPSIESYAMALNGRYLLCELEGRYGKAVLPDVQVIDMAEKTVKDPYFSISRPLADEISKNLAAGQQTILLMNRRGYNTFVACSACKKVMTCPSCSISLTYHSANHRLMCHYCGYSVPFVDACPSCGEHNIRYSGVGTQRLEEELQHRFREAKILRMDADTVGVRHGHQQALSAFESGEYDILLGTQMIAKGLNFPKVTLVGVVNIDQQIYNDDFRSSEVAFDLLTQVVGRAGRSEWKGRAVIQTIVPENGVLKLASKQDYKQFFKDEIVLRKSMIYPPYCDLCLLGFSGVKEDKVYAAAKYFLEELIEKNNNAEEPLKLIVLGPQAPRVSKINNKYRQRILIKCRNTTQFRSFLRTLLQDFDNDKRFTDVAFFADMNPLTAI
ncbi:MAG: primosomal protein N' [Clostridia bacterium]|nr:primosomal protein N' [Clostridia bacterium]